MADCEGEELDISGGALGSNQSLKTSCRMAFSLATMQDIPLLLEANENIQSLEISTIEISSDIVSPIVQAAEGHTSLNKLVLEYFDLEDEPVEAIGDMLGNAPALRELFLRGCS